MGVRIFFGGLDRTRPLTLLAAAAFGDFDRAAGTSWESLTAADLARGFRSRWQVAASMQDCDVVVLAHGYDEDQAAREVARLARTAGKPCVSFDGREDLPPTDPALGLVYRCSAFSRLGHERNMPVFPPDPSAAWRGGNPKPLAKEDVPRVGFCGYAGSRLQSIGLRLVGASQKADGLDLRLDVLRALTSDRGLRTDFIVRHRYFRGTGGDPQKIEQARQEYLTNLFNCPYNVAMRGKGNHSVRHYEILAAARIPVFVNTNCILPLEKVVPWRKHMVWVEASELGSIGNAIRSFHEALTPEAFAEVQASNRELSDRWLQPVPFFGYVLEELAAGREAP